MNLQSRYITDKSGNKYAPITTPNAVRFPNGDNLNDVLAGTEFVPTIVAPVNQTDPTAPITTLATDVGNYYRIDIAVETLAITLPEMIDVAKLRTVVIYLIAGASPNVTISSTAPSGGTAPAVHFSNDYAIEVGNSYEINCAWNGIAWIVACVKIEI